MPPFEGLPVWGQWVVWFLLAILTSYGVIGGRRWYRRRRSDPPPPDTDDKKGHGPKGPRGTHNAAHHRSLGHNGRMRRRRFTAHLAPVGVALLFTATGSGCKNMPQPASQIAMCVAQCVAEHMSCDPSTTPEQP